MRTSDIDILIVPGWTNSGPDHWLNRWQRNLRTARRVGPPDRHGPDCSAWADGIVTEVRASIRPVVLVAHSCGVLAVARAAPRLAGTRIAGAFLVAPPDPHEATDWPAHEGGFLPVSLEPLPFPSKLIASATDPFCSMARAQEFGRAWGSDVSVIADAGHIDTASGHGPWPEGLLTFGMFLKGLG